MLALINNYVIQLFNLTNLTENRLVPLSIDFILNYFQKKYTIIDYTLYNKHMFI
jgi:hypothetical protein